jgi:hypothetical protein
MGQTERGGLITTLTRGEVEGSYLIESIELIA